MLSFLSNPRVYLAAGQTDLRKSFDPLAGVVRSSLQLDPLSGHLFVFSNQRRHRAKILFWDKSGGWLCAQRLELGTLGWPDSVEKDLQKCPAPLEEVVAFWTRLTEQLRSEKRLSEFRIEALEKQLYGSRSEKISVGENELEPTSTVFVQDKPPVTADVVVPPDLKKVDRKKPVRRAWPENIQVVEARLEPADKTGPSSPVRSIRGSCIRSAWIALP